MGTEAETEAAVSLGSRDATELGLGAETGLGLESVSLGLPGFVFVACAVSVFITCLEWEKTNQVLKQGPRLQTSLSQEVFSTDSHLS